MTKSYELHGMSVCSGIGGLELAAEAFGVKTLAFCDKNKFSCKVINKNFPKLPVFKDVIKLDNAIKNNNKEIEKYGIRKGNIDIISAGWPCQSFSVSGRRAGRQDARGLIFDNVLSIAKRLEIPFILGENVSGSVSHEDGLKFWTIQMEKEGYNVSSFVFPASAFGLSHKRTRVFILATRFDYICQPTDSNRKLWNKTESEISRRFENNISKCQKGFLLQSSIPRVNYGIPTKLDAYRLAAIGNSVSPIQAEPIMQAIRLTYDKYVYENFIA